MSDADLLFTGVGWGIGCVEDNVLQKNQKFNTQFDFLKIASESELGDDRIEKWFIF